jgi:hypothetical protein
MHWHCHCVYLSKIFAQNIFITSATGWGSAECERLPGRPESFRKAHQADLGALEDRKKGKSTSFLKLPPYTLTGFDLMSHSQVSSVAGRDFTRQCRQGKSTKWCNPQSGGQCKGHTWCIKLDRMWILRRWPSLRLPTIRKPLWFLLLGKVGENLVNVVISHCISHSGLAVGRAEIFFGLKKYTKSTVLKTGSGSALTK